jgi:hypothetical protein
MSAALHVLTGAAVTSGMPDSGLFAAVIVAAAATALTALGMALFALHRTERLNGLRGVVAAGLSLGVVTMAIGGVLAVSPSAAQAAPDQAAPYVVTSSGDGLDVQLPTLALD